MLTLRKNEVRDKYSGEVIGEITRDTRRDLRAKIHRAFNAKEAVRRTSFAERAELGRGVGRLLTIHRHELEELMVREGGQPRKFARWEIERAMATATNLDRRLELLVPHEAPGGLRPQRPLSRAVRRGRRDPAGPHAAGRAALHDAQKTLGECMLHVGGRMKKVRP